MKSNERNTRDTCRFLVTGLHTFWQGWWFSLAAVTSFFCHLRSNIDPCVSEIIFEALNSRFWENSSFKNLHLDQAFNAFSSLVFNFPNSNR